LRDTNVLGACHAADFANCGTPKTLHHISTLSVFASTDFGTRASSKRTFDEQMNLHSARIVYGGYSQSKWAAELAVRGAHVTRLGLLLPSSRSMRGCDLFGGFVRAACVVGALPEGDAWRFDVTPVDFAADAIASFVMRAEAPRVRHVANREAATMDDLARAIECAGIALARVSLDVFRARVVEHGANLGALALASFRALTSDAEASRAFDLFEATHDLGAGPTLGDLARDGITCPPATSALASIVQECLR
jgi:thioester reductase-like protein